MFATLLLCCSAPVPAPPPALTARETDALVANLASDDPKASEAALKELTAAGPRAKAAVPALVKLLTPNHLKQYEAMQILGAIGPGAKEAVPALLKLLPKEYGSSYDAERVAVAVAAIDGPKPELTRALLMSNTKGGFSPLPRSQLLHAHPADVVRHLCALCADKDAAVRERAATVLSEGRSAAGGAPNSALFERAGDAVKLVPAALEQLLADERREVLLAAARAAVLVAPELSDKAVAAVVECAKVNVGKIKSGVYAHGVFVHVPERAAAALLPLFDSENEALRDWAAGEAGRLPIRAKLETVLKDGATARARTSAAHALNWQRTEAVPALTAALKDPAFEVRFAAAEALSRTHEPNARAAAVPALVEGLSAANERTRVHACDLLLRLRDGAKPAVPDLQKLLKNDSRDVRFVAALALADIDATRAAGAVPVLTAALSTSAHDASRAARALGEIGAPAKAALPELLKHFESKSVHLRIQSAGAAARIDPTRAPDAMKVLTAILQDPKASKGMPRPYAIAALAHIGPPAKAALPVLAELLRDDKPFHADVAVAMLVIDPKSAAAREWVRSALANAPVDAEDVYDLEGVLHLWPTACAALVPDLIAPLSAKESIRRQVACQALGAAGPAAKEALPKLKELAAKDASASVRRAAEGAVKKLEAK